MRVYFYNPNNDSGQDWGDGVVVGTAGNGERFGEASLPFDQFASRLYIYHVDPLERGAPELVPDAEIERVVGYVRAQLGRRPAARWPFAGRRGPAVLSTPIGRRTDGAECAVHRSGAGRHIQPGPLRRCRLAPRKYGLAPRLAQRRVSNQLTIRGTAIIADSKWPTSPRLTSLLSRVRCSRRSAWHCSELANTTSRSASPA